MSLIVFVLTVLGAILQAVVPPNVGCIGVRAVAYTLGCTLVWCGSTVAVRRLLL